MDDALAQRSRFSTLMLLLVLAVALGLRFWNLGFGLPHRYHVDEPPSVIAALRIAQGDLGISYPAMSPNLQQLLLTGLYSGLFLVQLATGAVDSPTEFACSYHVAPTPFYLLARAVSAVSSVMAIALLYLLARRFRSKRVALIAGLFLTFCFLDVRHAHFAEPYSLIALLALVCVYAAANHLSTGNRRWLAVSSVACGIGIGLRYSILVLGLVPLLAAMWRPLSSNGPRKTPDLARSLGLMALAVPFGILIGAPAWVVNQEHAWSGAGMQALLATTSEGFWGFEFTDLPTWHFYGTVLEIAWGWPVLVAAAIGVGLACRRHRPEDVLLLAFPIAYGAVLLLASASSSAFARYSVPMLPFIAVLAADGTAGLVGWLTRGRSARTAHCVLAMAVVASVAIPLTRIIRLGHLWSMTDTRTLAKVWIEANIPEGTRIAVQWHGPPLSTKVDPEPNSQRTYDLTLLDPFSADPYLYSLDYYQNNGFDYLILSSFIYELRRVDSADNAVRDAFYTSLSKGAALAAEFKPYGGVDEPSFFFEQIWGPITDLARFERPGPVIEIYRLR